MKNNAWANSDFRTTANVVGVDRTHCCGNSTFSGKGVGGFSFCHDAATGVDVGATALQDEGADHDAELGTPAQIEKAEGTGVNAAAHRLQAIEDRHGGQLGRAGHRPGWKGGPQQIENVISRMPEVDESCVVGVEETRWGQEVLAVIKLAEGCSLTEREVMDFCREHLAGYKCPKAVDFWDALPKTPIGKILRKDVKKRLWEGHDRTIG